MKPTNSASSFSKREKIRRKTCRRRDRRLISLRRSHTSRSYFRGVARRVSRGGTTGVKPRAIGVSRRPRRRGPSPARGWRVATKAVEEFESFRRVVRLSAGERERQDRPDIRDNHIRLGGPAAAGLASTEDRFSSALVPSGWTLTTVPSNNTASSLRRTIRCRCNRSKTRSSTSFLNQRFMRGCALPNRAGRSISLRRSYTSRSYFRGSRAGSREAELRV